MIVIIVLSIISAIATLLLAVFTEHLFFLVFTVISLVIFGISYSKYNRQKHPEEYKKTDNFNPDARIVANGSKAGLIITAVVLCVMIVLAIIYFVLIIG